MLEFKRNRFRYTTFFCEENIWWLVHDLVKNNPPVTDMQVLFLTNSNQSIALLNQKNTGPGQITVWDYHVILYATIKQKPVIFDFDSMLDFPVSAQTYAAYTFPQQTSLLKRYRSRVRTVEANTFLNHFHSDRLHMMDKIDSVSFPPDPPINPEPGYLPIDLSDYRNLELDIEDSQIHRLEDFLTIQSLT